MTPVTARKTFFSALDGVAGLVPTALGSCTLIYAQINPGLLSYAVFACMLSLVWIHVTTAQSQRPMLFSPRFFEATTLAALLQQLGPKLAGWGLHDGMEVRLAFLCLIGAFAGLWVGILWRFGAQRFTRYIPAPVYLGFSISLAFSLFISQLGAVTALLRAGQPWPVIGSVAGTVLVVAFGLRWLRPHWPATALALVAGALVSLAWVMDGATISMVGLHQVALTLPVALADFAPLADQAVNHMAVLGEVLKGGTILGSLMFINTAVTGQLLAQSDDKLTTSPRDVGLMSAGMVIAGAIGAPPLSGAPLASGAVLRHGTINGAALLACAAGVVLMFASGVLGWLPIAAVVGALLFEGWLLLDWPTFANALRWLRRVRLPTSAREDLMLIAIVTAVAVVLNMVAAVLVGLTLGLLMYAARNSRQPVRQVWTGAQVSSTCARAPADLALLDAHSHRLQVFELEGDQFFASAALLNQTIRQQLEGTLCAIIDWSRVRHIDSSLAQTVAKLEAHAEGRGIKLIHAGAGLNVGNVAALLASHLPQGSFAEDLDRALETAENLVLQAHGEGRPADNTPVPSEAISLFRGLSEPDRFLLEAMMVTQQYQPGEVIVRAGDPSDALLVVLQGTASVVLRVVEGQYADGRDVRIAGVRSGATLGEVGFLDRAKRSATVIAQDQVVIGSIPRSSFDALSERRPHIVQRVLSNIAVDLATRLRHSNAYALARAGQSQKLD